MYRPFTVVCLYILFTQGGFFLWIGGLNARGMMVKSSCCGWLVHSAHHMMMRHGKNIEQETYQNLESKSFPFQTRYYVALLLLLRL